jgi:hypothetical protein
VVVRLAAVAVHRVKRSRSITTRDRRRVAIRAVIFAAPLPSIWLIFNEFWANPASAAGLITRDGTHAYLHYHTMTTGYFVVYGMIVLASLLAVTRRVKRPDEPACLACGYYAESPKAESCPECGGVYAEPQPDRRFRRRVRVWAVACVLATLTVATLAPAWFAAMGFH